MSIALAQVAAALLTLQGRVIDSTSRPCLVPHRSPFLQYARCRPWLIHSQPQMKFTPS